MATESFAVTSINPPFGPTGGGTSVTVNGTGFTGASYVSFGDTQVPSSEFTSSSDVAISLPCPAAPPGGGTVDVTVSVGGVASPTSPADQFSYDALTMMTLAALATTASAQRPSGESVAAQEQRILDGIGAVLGNSAFAGQGGKWQAVWVGLSDDRANLAYIAQNTAAADQYAICIRGTSGSALDMIEDLAVGTTAELTAAGSPPAAVAVSEGANDALAEITNATLQIPNLTNSCTTLVEALAALVATATTPPRVYVVGHSLGGATATTVALYLSAQAWTPYQPAFEVYTFAAPTAGLQGFADYYDQTITANPPNRSWRFFNAWDVVPNAWATMSNLSKFYGGTGTDPTGPPQGAIVKGIVTQLSGLPGPNTYVQPNLASNTVTLNSDYGTNSSQSYPCGTLTAWATEVLFQHANNTYLSLLHAVLVPPELPMGPVIPTVGSIQVDGLAVTITGTGFTGDSVVDFGVAAGCDVDVCSTSTITATAPAQIGTVDVTVTNMFGTSPKSPADLFTFPAPPAVPPTVSAVVPDAGPVGNATPITVYGAGFTTDAVVNFTPSGGSAVPATDVVVVSLTELTAGAPSSVTDAETYDVTVTTADGTSGVSDADRYTFGPPVVTSISPDCVASAASGGSLLTKNQITINGVGLSNPVGVTIGGTALKSKEFTPGTDTSMTALVETAVAPSVVDVQVQTSASESFSAPWSGDHLTFY